MTGPCSSNWCLLIFDLEDLHILVSELKLTCIFFNLKNTNGTCYSTNFLVHLGMWHHGGVVITTAQLHSAKSELRFCAGSNPGCNVLDIHNGEDLWLWSWLEIRLNAFRWSTMLQKQFIIIMFNKTFVWRCLFQKYSSSFSSYFT